MIARRVLFMWELCDWSCISWFKISLCVGGNSVIETLVGLFEVAL